MFCWTASKTNVSQELMLVLIKGGTNLSWKFRKKLSFSVSCGDGKAHRVMRCTLDMCFFDCTVCDLTGWKQLERQELLFAWWLISDQQLRSQWGKQMKPFIFSSTLKLFFCSFFLAFLGSASKISPVLLTLPELSHLLQPLLSCL